MKVSKLKRNPNNPREIKDEKFDKLKRSISDFPQMMSLRPIIIDADNVVLGGNMRLAAIKALGMKDIPDEWVMRADLLTDEQKKEFIIKDNVGFGAWNWDTLANEWDEAKLIDWGLDIPGFEVVEAVPQEDEEAAAEAINKAAELQKKWGTATGQLWKLGEHRLLCGDSTSEKDVSRLMDRGRAELLFTSPPYSDQRDYDGESDLSVEHLVKFIPTFEPFCSYQVINLGLKRKDHEIVEYWQDYIIEARSCGYKLLSWNVWDKTQGGSIASATAMFLQTHEWLFVFGQTSKPLNRTVPNQLDKYEARHGKDWQAGLSGKSIRQADGSMTTTTSKTYINHQLHSVIQQVPELSDARKNHPAMFPVDLPKAYIEAMTNAGDTVCEPFLGSGTTLIACEQLNRKCYAIEIAPEYVAVALERWHNLTNQTPELIEQAEAAKT